MAPRRPSTGRKKIEIRRIENKQARQVCFTRRRAGLFKKASELSTLCGAEVAAVAISPGRKPFSFGHPSVDYVLNRFLPANSPETQATAAAGAVAIDLKQALADLNQENGKLRTCVEEEKAQKQAAEEILAKARAEGCQATAWQDAYVFQMGEGNLAAFGAALAKVRAAVAARAQQVLLEARLTRLTLHGGDGGFEFGGISDGMKTENQLQMLTAIPPPPGFAADMPQGFGPHGFPQ